MANVDAINNFPTPTNKKQLMRFLGMIGFYRKFFSNFATVVQPLTLLLRKDSNLSGVKIVNKLSKTVNHF
jgi:hypothetical protein